MNLSKIEKNPIPNKLSITWLEYYTLDQIFKNKISKVSHFHNTNYITYHNRDLVLLKTNSKEVLPLETSSKHKGNISAYKFSKKDDSHSNGQSICECLYPLHIEILELFRGQTQM